MARVYAGGIDETRWRIPVNTDVNKALPRRLDRGAAGALTVIAPQADL